MIVQLIKKINLDIKSRLFFKLMNTLIRVFENVVMVGFQSNFYLKIY